MQINTEAPVFHSKEIHIDATPERVWKVLTEINHWHEWKDNISKSEIEGLPVEGNVFKWIVNKTPITSTIHTAKPHNEFGWEGKTFGAKAIHNWYLHQERGGTRLEVVESMEGWLVRLFKKKMSKDLKADMQDWLVKLKTVAETG